MVRKWDVYLNALSTVENIIEKYVGDS